MLDTLSRRLWYRDDVIYCLDVETFQDSNGDGIGDFPGLSQRLDYLDSLGVNCLWLLPFYPTVNRDNGYDVTDFYGIDPRLGTLGDFVEFMTRAEDRGIRVIVDLVVNHTSDQHPWFQAARADRESKYHDYYVWKDEKPADADEGVVFPGVQESIWTYDRKARRYYLHRFYEHQPDLNIDNPAVRNEICRIMGFWLKLGISGFRLDAAPFLIELKGIDDPDSDDPLSFLHEFRNFVSFCRGDAILLAEANVPLEKVPDYFGDGDRLHMLFNFLLNQQMFLALAQQRAKPIYEALRDSPPSSEVNQFANFLRNHDELDLGRLTDEQREFVFQQFAPDPDMRLYDRGIRRRLPPMLNGDERRLRMAYSLMFSMPGTPILRYGEEIGMGDDLSLEERDSIRTVMQWSPEEHGGFTSQHVDAGDLPRPAIRKGTYGYLKRNVYEQQRDADSLLNWMRKLIRVRRECPECSFGTCTVLEADDSAVLAHECRLDETAMVSLHNLSDKTKQVEVTFEGDRPRQMTDLLADDGKHWSVNGGSMSVELGPYGFHWFHSRPEN
ncbi:MAG: alpha-glucosidase C-terminal domain-containing protein [Planctomycetaceae bacterium]|nr:alpha-glucosidase C-terminal domain-containing protein [Planctomycetaceae bacterium]